MLSRCTTAFEISAARLPTGGESFPTCMLRTLTDRRELLPKLSGGLDHVPERGLHLLVGARLQAAVGVDPELGRVEHLRRQAQQAGHLVGSRHARGVDVVHAGTYLAAIAVLPH